MSGTTIVNHMMVNNLFSSQQYGFVNGTAIAGRVDKCYIDKGDSIDTVYLDFTKAFDKVPHNRLMSKLNSIGINTETLHWIRPFYQTGFSRYA